MKEQWNGKSYDDTIMSPEAFARFLRRRLDEGLSVEGYSYSCTNGSLDRDIDERSFEVTTPFSDDLGTEDNYCYPRELGEVHDTFNVVIQGSGNPITLTRQVIRSSQDDGSYLQSMVDVLSKLRSDK
jgi:hypothetical protein